MKDFPLVAILSSFLLASSAFAGQRICIFEQNLTTGAKVQRICQAQPASETERSFAFLLLANHMPTSPNKAAVAQLGEKALATITFTGEVFETK